MDGIGGWSSGVHKLGVQGLGPTGSGLRAKYREERI